MRCDAVRSAGDMDRRQAITGECQVEAGVQDYDMLVASALECGNRGDGERAGGLTVPNGERTCRVDVDRLPLGDTVDGVTALGEALRRRGDGAGEGEIDTGRRVSQAGRLPRDGEAVAV